MPINPDDAFNSLVNGTEAFLKTYPVRIFGHTGPSGISQYALENRGNSYRPGSILGTHKLHATESFNIRATAARLHANNSHIFPAHSIHMDEGIDAMTLYQLTNAGPNIMVTGQLSGCAFVIFQAGAHDVNVAHIKPVGTTGPALAATLTNRYHNAFVYGATAGHGFYNRDDRVVSIIGIRDAGGSWKIYAQKHDATSGDYTIRSVYRIHPNHTKL
jgi:hypothetical protein